MRPPARAFTAAIVVMIGASCSAGGSSTPDDTQPAFTTTTTPSRSDGVLRIGLLLPQSGDGSGLGSPLIEIAQGAIDAVNAAGGVLGHDVELVVADEGGDTTTALTSIDEMVASHSIDALIGPLSSNVALGVVPHLVELGVGTCSPAATSASLVALPDDGLFVRTTPSDDLASQAMAQLISQTGVASTALAYPDDPYGRTFADSITRALALQGISISPEVAYDPSQGDFTDSVDALTDGGPSTITLIGDRDGGGRLLTELLGRDSTATVIVNDGLADVDLSTLTESNPEIATHVVGVAVDAFSGADEVSTLIGTSVTTTVAPSAVVDIDATGSIPPFAAAVVDCINLLTIAAEIVTSDDAVEFMPQVIPASRVGSSCRTFATCMEVSRAGLNVDYNGPTGVLALNPNGDPSQATFVTFGFDDSGRSVFRTQLGVFSAP